MRSAYISFFLVRGTLELASSITSLMLPKVGKTSIFCGVMVSAYYRIKIGFLKS